MPGRTIAIGDIHGCAQALDALLALVDPRPIDRIVTLGDYIDNARAAEGLNTGTVGHQPL